MDSSPSGSASTNKQAESSASSAPPAGPSTSSSAAAASSSATTQNAPSTANHATQTTDLGSSESSSAAAAASSSGAGSSHTASTETTSVAAGTQGTKSTQGTQTPQATEESSSSAGTEDAWTLVSTGAPAAATASATASATTMTGALPSDQEPPSADKAAPAPEDQSTPADGADADDKSEDTEKGDIFKTRQKPGPSSSLTAAEWDGGMDKDDVPADFDPENDDGEDEEEEDTKGGETAEDKKVEKGKGRAVPVQPTKDKAHRSTKKDSTTTGAVEKTEGEKDSEKKEKVTKEPKKLLLIDLPLDVLREIMREVTNTTDLCSLSLSHSSLHALAIPHIYSRFDIVWPDMNIPSERTGVDALTYGLATLVSPKNSYARYIRKFSLGNGPKDWVNEYLINKEGGKMLGTLVSLAIYKMEALETFHWDMPTGVLRDVWMALHELKTVKNVHVRWHDNTHTDVVGSQDPSRRVESPSFSGFKDLKSISSLDVDEVRYMREIATAIEKSYSTLKELRLGVAVHAQTRKWVTDDEASANSSQDGAGEGGIVGLAVGKVCDVKRKPNKPPGEANAANAAGNNESLTQEQLAAALQSQQQQQQQQQQAQGTDGQSTPTPTSNNSNSTSTSTSTPAANTTGTSASSNDTDNTATPTLGTATANASGTTAPPTTTAATAAATTATTAATSEQASEAASDEQLVPSRQLKLETIEFERIPLSTRVLSKAFDFTSLVNLTLLGCGNHHRLFKLLRKKYSPYPITDKNPSGSTGSSSSTVPTSRAVSIIPPTPNYKLKLKKIHTDSVSPSLLSFINQTLAPNTLETLFLQEHQDNEYSTPTALNLPQLPLRRHRLSLKRILIDSYVENPDSQPQNQNNPTTPTVLSRKSKWKFNRETLTFLTERMPNLKEAGFTIDYKDWHFFLTRLPEMGSLRSLYLPHVIVSSGPDVHNPERQAEEMAMQIVDVVTLRPECGICYVGILNKCFELLESDESSSSSSSSSASSAAGSNATNTGAGSGAGGGGNAANANAAQAGAEVSEDEDDDDDEDGDDDGDEEGDDDDDDDEDEGDDTEDAEEGEEDQDALDGEAAAANAAAAAGMTTGGINHNAKDDDGDGDAADHGPRNKRIRIKHREILFYEDKVAVFKARHARL